MRTARLLAVLSLALPPLAVAQEAPPEASPVSSAPTQVLFGVRLGAFDMINSDESYDAVYGSEMFQGGLHLDILPRPRLQLGLTLDYGTKSGERVFPTNPPVPTGVDDDLTLMPLHLSASYVFGAGGAPWYWYLGAGPTLLRWEEESVGRSESATDFGGNAVAGVRWPRTKWQFGGELRYSTVPDAVGDEGAAAIYGEDDLGGIAVHFLALYQLK